MSLKQIFNKDSLLHFVEGDLLLSKQLLTMSVQDIPIFFNNASILIQNNNFLDAAVWIHKIKGIAGTVGAEVIYDLCLSIEIELKELDTFLVNNQLLNKMNESIDAFCKNKDVQDSIINAQA